MKITDFDVYSDLLKEKSGLMLTPDKSYIIFSRLRAVAQKWGFTSLASMTRALQGVPDSDLVTDITEAMTSNDTSFFCDSSSFNALKDSILPYILKSRASKRQIRILCLGCSSGQEPYSIAILLKDMERALAGWKVEILATDLSNQMIRHAQTGIYSQAEAQRGLPVPILLKHFTQNEKAWSVNDHIREIVRFQQFNMLDDMEDLGNFNIIFCRNVLQFFDDSLRKKMLQKIEAQLKPDGFLILDPQENIEDSNDRFALTRDKNGIYASHRHPLQNKSSS